jgi:hypothetical protein
MATATKTRNTAINRVRESSKRDPSPKWDGAESMSAEQFAAHFREAMKYYNIEHSGKDLKPKVIDWMGRNGYSKDEIADFKRTKDSRCGVTMGAIAACLIKGMPVVRKDFNQGRDSSEWLRNEIRKVTYDGREDIEVDAAVKATKVVAPVPNIQDRIREQAGQMSEELDAAIDSFITDPNAFDPKAFKIVNLLRGKGAKAAQARYIKSFFERGHSELMELASGNADEQLREGYKHHPRKNIKKLIEFYEAIAQACEQITAEAKILKKPRAKKIKPAEELVKKLKFCVKDDKLGVVSVPPAGIIGAQGVVVLNVKTRKIGYYISKSSNGLSVKGTSIIDFTEKSFQKTLRVPASQLKEYKEQNTQKRFETWFNKSVKTTETALTGRINEDVIILKVFK